MHASSRRAQYILPASISEQEHTLLGARILLYTPRADQQTKPDHTYARLIKLLYGHAAARGLRRLVIWHCKHQHVNISSLSRAARANAFFTGGASLQRAPTVLKPPPTYASKCIATNTIVR
jgi:hypothetical protein